MKRMKRATLLGRNCMGKSKGVIVATLENGTQVMSDGTHVKIQDHWELAHLMKGVQMQVREFTKF